MISKFRYSNYIFLFSVVFSNTYASNVFQDNGNGTISDLASGLTWQQQDDDMMRTQLNSFFYCRNLNLAGLDDWRLPNLKELTSIVDFRRREPAIEERFFPDTKESYWSITSVSGSGSADGWSVDFVSGRIDDIDDSDPNHVRCVRGDFLINPDFA